MFASIYLNFFTVSIVIGTAFYLIIGLILLLAIPDRTKATTHFGISYVISAVLAAAFIPAHMLYEPVAAYHRWLSVPAALLVHCHYAQIFYHFPETRWRKAARLILGVQYAVAIILTGYFYYITAHSTIVYNFSAHLWDFDADDASKLVGAMILLNIGHIFISGMLNVIFRPGHRLVIGGMLAALMFAVTIPSITNIMGRNGLISWDVHQTFLIINSVTGMFALLVIFLNHAKERTSFMLKIVGMSMVTFMVLLIYISLTSFQDQEQAYDRLRSEQASRLSIEPDYPVSDLQYLLAYDLESNEFYGTRATAHPVDRSRLEYELRFAAYFEKIRALKDHDRWRNQLEHILNNTTSPFGGYRAMLRESAPSAATPADLLNHLEEYADDVRYYVIKISHLPEEDFQKGLEPYLQDMQSGDLRPFAETIRAALATNEQLDPKDRISPKAAALQCLRPFHGAGYRHYRTGADSQHYTAFVYYRPETDTIYEAGFSYRVYREFIHRVGLRLTIIFIVVMVVIAFGFRLFFLGTLIRPLQRLLSGVRRVNRGQLDVQVQVSFPDEFGFLTESFNRMVGSIRQAREKLERHAVELEEKVKERTAELSETLQTVQHLKTQQDGDYFLTSLLIKPLTRNLTRSDSVRVDFLMEQKKKFSFRRWEEEIGGDFCSAHSIQLQNKTHTVFINADAMGKSIQGASGALVLGAVFESLMDRTRNVPAVMEQSPERWMKNAFLELHSVFESFDCTMLVSMVLGLIDDATGLMYYVNVEHPWSIVYRKGTAEFIEREHAFRKLGTPGLNGRISIHTFQFQPDDILLVGSDGRDDILMETDENPERRVMNEDEHLFRRIVELGGADLGRIHQHLQEMGSLTDDLSLIRIEYNGPREQVAADTGERIAALLQQVEGHRRQNEFEEAIRTLNEALRINPHSIRTIRSIVRLHLDRKAYEDAYNHIEQYIYLQPRDTQMMYLAAYLCKKLRRFRDAADFGERVRLRNPELVRNLLNLAQVHIALNNYDRAEKMLQEALELDPDNRRAIKINKHLGARKELRS